MFGGFGTECQGEAVKGLLGRMCEEVRNVENSLFMFEDGAAAGEGEFPAAEPLAQGVAWLGLLGTD